MSIDELHTRFLSCSGASTDTRVIAAGSMFFALKGPAFDANAFAAEALEKGAQYAVVDDPRAVKNERYALVPDVLTALQDLARLHRRRFNIPVLGITGSNGKTTTKELFAAVLGSAFPTLATAGNLNNQIGVPLTLLRLAPEHRMAIIEMGANKPGDIAELCAIAEPTHGLITNIGKAHLEGFGDFEGVVRTKTELYASVDGAGGELFVNADDPLLMEKAGDTQIITYGTRSNASTRGHAIGDGPFLSLVFEGRTGAEHRADMQLIGNYNLPNALAAVAAGQHFGVGDVLIADALANYRPGNNRSQFKDTGRNHLVLDAYNANPTSMAAALENFAAMTSDHPKLAILGDMLELGTTSDAEHREVIALAARAGFETKLVGPRFQMANEGSMLDSYPDAAALLDDLRADPVRGRLILLKGSRGMRLEDLVPVL